MINIFITKLLVILLCIKAASGGVVLSDYIYIYIVNHIIYILQQNYNTKKRGKSWITISTVLYLD